MLSGQLPESLGKLPYNKLTGNIPPEVAGLQNLQFYFNVSGNLLQGCYFGNEQSDYGLSHRYFSKQFLWYHSQCIGKLQGAGISKSCWKCI
ncbi:hypothetical protein SUGI_1082730 [Cryptomeria japonica]|nr:hypothetical protein SUGI_1082730 [Cryptomeria japonica]